MHSLANKGFLAHEKYGGLKLSPEGQRIAEKIYTRHLALTAFFTQIVGVPVETAEKDACAVEHVISEESMNRIINFIS